MEGVGAILCGGVGAFWLYLAFLRDVGKVQGGGGGEEGKEEGEGDILHGAEFWGLGLGGRFGMCGGGQSTVRSLGCIVRRALCADSEISIVRSLERMSSFPWKRRWAATPEVHMGGIEVDAVVHVTGHSSKSSIQTCEGSKYCITGTGTVPKKSM